MNAGFIKEALRQRHQPPEWVYLTEVRTRTGESCTYARDMDSTRYIDAFALNLYRSKSYWRVAYEVKVSKQDFWADLRDPKKRARAYFLSHEFWYAVAPGIVPEHGREWMDIIHADGLGILEVQEDGAIVVRQRAAKREAFPMPDTFVASLLRRACRVSAESDVLAVA